MECKCIGFDYTELLELLKTISEENRLKIICFLKKKERCVCEIVKSFNLPHNLLSHHLKLLKKVGLLTSKRKGKFIYYKIEKQKFNSFLSQFKQIVEDC